MREVPQPRPPQSAAIGAALCFCAGCITIARFEFAGRQMRQHSVSPDPAPCGLIDIGANLGQRDDLGETGHIGKGLVSAQDALLVLGNGADSHAVSLVVGAERPDVAKALKSETLAQAGFNLLVALDDIPAGSYNLSVVMDPATSAHCDLKTTLVLE